LNSSILIAYEPPRARHPPPDHECTPLWPRPLPICPRKFCERHRLFAHVLANIDTLAPNGLEFIIFIMYLERLSPDRLAVPKGPTSVFTKRYVYNGFAPKSWPETAFFLIFYLFFNVFGVLGFRLFDTFERLQICWVFTPSWNTHISNEHQEFIWILTSRDASQESKPSILPRTCAKSRLLRPGPICSLRPLTVRRQLLPHV